MPVPEKGVGTGEEVGGTRTSAGTIIRERNRVTSDQTPSVGDTNQKNCCWDNSVFLLSANKFFSIIFFTICLN